MNYLFNTLICGYAVSSAQWQDTIKGNNVLDSLQLTTQKFDRIEIPAPFDVIVEKGDHYGVKIIGESNVIPEVFTEVKNNSLLLSTSNNVKFFGNAMDRTQLIVTTKDISEICVLGSAKVSSTSNVESKYLSLELIGSGEISLTIESQNISVDITGSGNVELKGNCKIIKGKVIGSGILHTKQLKSKKSFIKIVGSGQASVCSSEKLHASINGTADVTYVGEPKEVDITTWLGDKKHQYSVGHSSMDSNEQKRSYQKE